MRNTKNFLILKSIVISFVCLVILTFIFPYNYDLIQPPPHPPPTGILKEALRLDQNVQRSGPEQSSYVQEGKLFILLIGGFRTGSSFLGELFNQNPDVLYQYEPLNQATLKRLVAGLQIFGVTERSTTLKKQLAYLDQITQKCRIGKPYFEEMTLVKRCGTEEVNLLRFGSRECPPGSERIFGALCKTKKTMVLKIVRLQRIEHLTLLPNLKKVNFRIIHLMRDPRGTMNSRMNFGSSFINDTIQIPLQPPTLGNMSLAAEDLCQRELDNLMFSERLPGWMKGRYYRTTHRDLSLHPIQYSKDIYKFVGLPIPKSLEDWLLENTDSKNEKNGTKLSTKRDSKSVINKWKEMDIDMVKVIEKSCDRLMKYMGYKNWDGKLDDD